MTIDFHWIQPLLSNLELWRGAARLLLDLFLIYAMFMVVLTISGHPVNAWPLRKRESGATEPKAGQQGGGHAVGEQPATAGKIETRQSTERHLEYLDQLRTALKY